MTSIDREMQAAAMLKIALGELTTDDPDLLLNMVEGSTNLFEMVDQLLEQINETLALHTGLTHAISTMSERADRFESRVDRLRSLISRAMELCETKKLERPLATIIMANRAPSVVIISEDEIPATYWVLQPPKLDKKALADDLKAGEHIPGATLSNAMPSLTIRRS